MNLTRRIAVFLLLVAPAVTAWRRVARGCRGALVARPSPGEWIGATELDRPRPMTISFPGAPYSLFFNMLGTRVDCAPDAANRMECNLRLPEACIDRKIALRSPLIGDGDALLRYDARRDDLVLAGRNTWYASFRIVPPGVLVFGWPRLVAWLLAFGLGAVAMAARRPHVAWTIGSIAASLVALSSLWI